MKCYYHPKLDSSELCLGCKLPVCTECRPVQGHCADCAKRRESIHLRRTAIMMAQGEAGGRCGTATVCRSVAPKLSPAPARSVTRPLPSVAAPRTVNDGFLFATASEKASPRRYRSDEVAYKPVANPLRAAHAASRAKRPSWVMPFALGLAVGLGVLAMQGVQAPDSWNSAREVSSMTARAK